MRKLERFLQKYILTALVLVSGQLAAQDYLESERKLLDYFSSRCNSAEPLTKWPLGFEHPTDKIACDALALLEEPYSAKNRYLYHTAYSQGRFEYIKLDNQIRADYLGKMVQPTPITIEYIEELAKKGDPEAFLNLINSNAYRPSTGTSEAFLKFYPSQVVKAFSSVGSWSKAELEEQIEWTAFHSAELSPELLGALVRRIGGEVFFGTNGNLIDVYEKVLDTRYTTRNALLSLVSLIPLQDDSFLRFLRAISWVPSDYYAAQRYAETPFQIDIYEPEISNYLGMLRRLEDLHIGIPSGYVPSLLIENVAFHRSSWDELRRFDRFFPNAIALIDKFRFGPDGYFLNTTPSVQELTSSTDPQLKLLAYMELYTLSGFDLHPREVSPLYGEGSSRSIEELFREAQQFVFSEFELTGAVNELQSLLDQEEREAGDIELERWFAERTEELSNTCDYTESEECFRKWLSFSGMFELPIVDLDSQTSECTVRADRSEKLVTKLLQNYILFDSLSLFCSLDSLASLSGGSLDLTHELMLLQGYAPPRGGIRWARSLGVTSGELSVLGSHFLARNPLKNFPVPYIDTYLSTRNDRNGWSYLKRLSSESEFSYEEQENAGSFPNFQTYAEIETLFGNYGKAFRSRLDFIEEQRSLEGRPLKPWGSFSNMFYLGKNLGIPRSYLAAYIRQHEAFDWDEYRFSKSDIGQIQNKLPELYGESDPAEVIARFSVGYTSAKSAIEALELLQSDRVADKFEGVGVAYSLNQREKEQFCKDPFVINELLSGNDKTLISVQQEVYSRGSFARYEGGNLDSICRVEALRLIAEKGYDTKEFYNAAVKSYEELLDQSFTPFITADQNFTDLRYLDSVVAFAELSAVAQRKFGLVFSMLALKAIYVELAESYVQRDALTLRTEQRRIERALAALAAGIDRMHSKGEFQPRSPEHISVGEQHVALILGAHNPLLTDKYKRRVLGATSFDSPSDEVNQQIVQTEKDLEAHRSRIAAAKNVFEFVELQASAKTPKLSVSVIPFRSANAMNTLMIDQGSAVPAYLNIIAGPDVIYAFGHDRNKRLQKAIWIGRFDMKPIIEALRENSTLGDSERELVCTQLRDFHTSLAPILDSAPAIFLTPSVNLFPLPTELLIGQDCEAGRSFADAPVILVNDYISTQEFELASDGLELPAKLVGVGNPILEVGGFDIDMGDWRSGNLVTRSGGSVLDLQTLPPLPDAEIEIEAIRGNFSDQVVYLGPDASLSNAFTTEFKTGSRPERSLLVLATHGFTAGAGSESSLPGLLSVEGDSLSIVPAAQLYDYRFEDSVVLLSACDTAGGFVEEPDKMFTGFVKTFGDRGVHLVAASLWPVNTVASREVTEGFVKGWKNGELKEAVRAAKVAVTNSQYRWPFVFIYP